MFNKSDLYGFQYGVTTAQETAPEPAEQQALANEETAAINPNTKGMMTWLGVIVLAVVLLSFGGGK